jgi:hypothetical protein
VLIISKYAVKSVLFISFVKKKCIPGSLCNGNYLSNVMLISGLNYIWWYDIWYDDIYNMLWYMICDIWYGTIWIDMIWYVIYLLTAIGLIPGGSSTVHIYTQTVHRTIQLTNLVGRK